MAVDKKIKLYIQAEIKEAEQRLKKFVDSQKNIKKENDKLKQSFIGLGKTIVSAFAVRAIANFSKESLILKARADSLNIAFKNLGSSVGFNEDSLNKFRQATNGTVSDVDLMIQANNAMLLGIVENDEAFAELIDNAQRLAKAVGQDALFGIESLTTGIGRQSKLMLDNLGIVLDTNLAYEKFAQANGKAVKDLDENERKQAFIQAALESTASKVAELGEETLDTNDTIAQLDVAMENLKIAFGEFVEGPGVSFINFLSNVLQTIPGVIEYVDNFVDGMIDGIKRFPSQVDDALKSIGKEQEIMFTYAQPTGPQLTDAIDSIRSTIQSEISGEDGIDILGDLDLEPLIEMEDTYTNFIEENIKQRKKLREQEHKERIQQNLQMAILQGQSAKQAGVSVIKAEIAKSTASLITKIMQAVPFPLNLALAAGAGGMVGKVTDQLFSSFATGGSFIAKGRTTLPIGNGVMVGDNASGMERIDVTPLPAPPGANDRNINIYISAPLVDETVVDHIIPAIRRAEKLGL